jgi:amidase
MPVDDTSAAIMNAFEKSLDTLRSAGATIIEETNFTAAAEYRSSNLSDVIPQADFVVNLQSYLDKLVYNPNNITSLAALRAFTQSSPLEDYPERDTATWDQALENWNNTDPHFWPAYLQYLYFGEEGGLLGAIQRHGLDAVVLPAKYATDWAAMVGTPIITVPLGFYPEGTAVVKNSWGLVEAAPNIP